MKKERFGSNLAKVDAHEVTQEELDEIPEMTPEQLARATYKIRGKIVTEKEFRAHQAQWLRDHPEAARKIAARIGRPPLDNPKTAVSLRLDTDVIEYYRATGPGWQTRINDTLRKAARLKQPASRKTGTT